MGIVVPTQANAGPQRRAALLLVLLVCLPGCAARLVHNGQFYLVQWPGQTAELVEVYRVRRDGWAECRSEKETVIWACNFNAASYFVLIQRTPPTPGVRLKV